MRALAEQAGARARAVAAVFGLSESAADVEAALLLLAHSKWDEEALVDRWSEEGEAAVRAATGVAAAAPRAGDAPDAGLPPRA